MFSTQTDGGSSDVGKNDEACPNGHAGEKQDADAGDETEAEAKAADAGKDDSDEEGADERRTPNRESMSSDSCHAG